MDTCEFCNSVLGGERIIYQNGVVAAFPTFIPITPGHTVIIPVRHVGKIDDLTAEELSAIQSLIVKIKNSLIKSFNAEGFNVAFNEGAMAGQSIPHLHIHIVPRKTGDSGVYGYEPRKFLYRPGSRQQTPEAELSQVAKIIKDNL